MTYFMLGRHIISKHRVASSDFQNSSGRPYRDSNTCPAQIASLGHYTKCHKVLAAKNDSYEITMNGFQVRNINEIRNVIFGLRYGKPSSALIWR